MKVRERVALHVLLCFFEPVTNGEQKLGNIAPTVEIGLDPAENAAVFPIWTRLAGAALGSALRDQFDHAERLVRSVVLHDGILAKRRSVAIRCRADRAAGTYGHTGARGSSECTADGEGRLAASLEDPEERGVRPRLPWSRRRLSSPTVFMPDMAG
jgi:hypothetical protein